MLQSSKSSVQDRASRQLIMLSAAFLLGMGVNLVGTPSETTGLAKTASMALLSLHGLVGIGLLVGAILTLKQTTVENRRLGRIGIAAIVITFAAGVLTMATNNNWWSYVMAAGFLGSFWVYGVLYLRGK